MRLIIVALWLVLALPLHASTAWADLREGLTFGNLPFAGAISAEDRAYLGLSRPGDFTLKDIQARYVLVEIFSDICPHCMLQAPIANRLYNLIQRNPRLRGDGAQAGLKMMGLGYYSNQAAMDKWRARYQVPFPLVPDPKGQAYKTLDAPGTPTYVVFDHQGEVVYVHAGEIASPERFLRQVMAHLE